MSNFNICSLVRELEDNYIDRTTRTSKYVDFNLSETIDTIYAYLNSKHISGSKDSKGRDKPFFNIVTAASNIWYRATDIDRKNIRIKATKRADEVKSFIATILLQQYMRESDFGTFLNQWGLTLARFGSAMLKFVDKGDELTAEVVSFNRLIFDAIDAENNPIIEVLEMTPAQLRNHPTYDQEMVESLIESSKTARETLNKEDKDTVNDFIKLYEIHGNLPLSYLTGEEKDENTYVQQMHVISFVPAKDAYDDYTLVKGREKNPYMMTHLIKEDGRSIGIGAVEHLFEAQWMTNHSQKSIKDQLDLASKLIFQTSDNNFVGRNVLKSIDNGEIMVHQPNQPITQVQNNSHDITALQNFGIAWQNLAKEITSTPDAIAGNKFPSGTAYRQVVALQQEAHSLFEIMTENKGLAIENMMRRFIIPFLKRKMNTTEEIVGVLDVQGIKKIDSMFIPQEAIKKVNEKIIDRALQGQATTLEEQEEMIAQETESLTQAFDQDGQTRYIKPSAIASKTWNETLKDFEWEVEVEVTGETSDKEAMLVTLTTVLQSIAANPTILQDPNARTLFNKILVATGEVSPIELSALPQTPTQNPQQLEELTKVGQT